MIWVHLLVVLAAIFLGARLGGIAIGFMWVVSECSCSPSWDWTPGDMPLDVISIIMAVICAIAPCR